MCYISTMAGEGFVVYVLMHSKACDDIRLLLIVLLFLFFSTGE
jgi:hypothetical protein